jgi:hypothetical protein
MKALLCGLLVFVATGLASAQTPMRPPQPVVYPMQGTALAQPTAPAPTTQLPAAPTIGTPTVIAAPAAATGACCPAPACCPTPVCAAPCKTCVREPATKTITHVCYSKTCEEFCLPKCSCSCFASLCGGCLGCEPIHTKYYLVKKVRTETCPTTKCVPSLAPVCGGCCAPACR